MSLLTPQDMDHLIEESLSLELELAKGQDLPWMYDRLEQIDRLMDVSAWMFDPDSGSYIAKSPLQVCQSAAGFYIGRFSETDGPISRNSVEYWPKREQAESALAKGTWTKRPHP